MIAFILFTRPAMAWGWVTTSTGGCSGVTWPTDSVGYLMFSVDGDFSTAERNAIEAGVAVWNAGPGTVNRGASFEYTIDGYKGSGQSVTNTINEIHHIKHDDGVSIFGLPDKWIAWGPSVSNVNCTAIQSADIVLDRDNNWKTTRPSVGSGDSLQAVVVHEAGHNMGLAHEPDHPAVMYRRHFSENGLLLRLGEDEYSFLRSQYTLATNEGKNFLLTKFNTDGTGARPHTEGWTADEDWEGGACGTVDVSAGPHPVWASVNGTASSYSTPIQWTLSNDPICFDDDDIVIGARTPSMASNVPYEVEPSGGSYVIPSSTPDGDYWVCAGINPDESISEAEDSYLDDIIISEKKWTIDCP